MDSIGNRIRLARKNKPMTQAYLASILDIERKTLYHWERNITQPSGEMINRLAQVLGTSANFLLHGIRKEREIPVYGSVKAGVSLEPNQIIGYEEMPAYWSSDYEYFALKAIDDSMEPRMYVGDVVIVRRQSDVDSGDIAIVLVNGNDAAIRKVLKSPDGITLQPLNFKYQSTFYSHKDIEKLPVAILGRVVELRAKY
jgi:repressor LexA